MSLTGSTPCRPRARCLVCVSTSSLSSLVIDGVRHSAALARDVWYVLAHHRYRRLSLPGSTPCLARCVVFVRTSSLSSHVIVGFPALSLLLLLWGMSTPWVVFARERRDRFCGRVMLLAVLYKSCVCSSVRADIALPSSGIRRCPCYCTERPSPPLIRECAPAGLTLFLL